MNIIEEMIELKADGIVFHPISSSPRDKNCTIFLDCSFDEFIELKSFPKSNRTYYKIEEGKRIYIK